MLTFASSPPSLRTKTLSAAVWAKPSWIKFRDPGPERDPEPENRGSVLRTKFRNLAFEHVPDVERDLGLTSLVIWNISESITCTLFI